MLSAEEITPFPEEQERIEALRGKFEHHYDPELLYYNWGHPYEEVLPEVLRLDELSTGSSAPSRQRLQDIAFSLLHDVDKHMPLAPGDGFSTKEERSSQIAAEKLPDFGYDMLDIKVIRGMIEKTTPGTHCTNNQERKARRGDLTNVGSKQRVPFLAKTVAIFHDEITLCHRAGKESPTWETFVVEQRPILEDLLSDDLTIGPERSSRSNGSFNMRALRNARWLSKAVVRNPERFVRQYGKYFTKPPALIPNFVCQVEPLITGQADV